MKKSITHLFLAVLLIVGASIVGSTQAQAQCQASFTFVDNGSGNFSFTNTSTGNFLFYYWTFGDGNSSYNTNATHTYTSNGAYQICLNIYDSISQCQSTFCDSVLVTGLSCQMNAPNFTMDSLCNAHFTANNFGSTYFWDFGDGNFSSQQNPVHQYANNGWYWLCLTADSCTRCDSVYISCNIAQPCNVNAAFNSIDNGNGNFSFTNQSTGSNLSYYWNFGDGSWSSTTSPSHTYQANGTYAVQLYAFDMLDSNCYDLSVQTIVVSGISNPVACQAGFIVYPDSMNPGNVIVVNNSTGNFLSYYWTFGDGNSSTLAYPSYTYSGSGPYELCLTVYDSINNCTSTYCDSIFSGGIVLKPGGFTINVIAPGTTGIEDELKILSGFEAYPNPAQDHLYIEVELMEAVSTEIVAYDLLGNQVAMISQEMLSQGHHTIMWNTGEMTNGIYLLHVKTGQASNFKKVIINH
ncbi:MAG: PKD domain-containing protein [Flavobacteriales bacterium]|nr:PKD domain-containing protein [Flavobacteriales bacterium]